MLESWRLVLWCGVRLFLVGGVITYSAVAPALGLGDITLHSALNQPLSADIALVDVGGLEEGELSVSLATADEFSRVGVERVLFLNNLKFTPILRGNRSLIRVTSNKAVKEPFLNFVVQLNQPNGRLLREYTVLIDPPGTPGIEPVADEPVAEPESSAFPAVNPVSTPSTPVKQPASANPAIAPVGDPVVAEQLADSVLQNQQLQKNLDELNGKLAAQDEQIIGQKKQIAELQTRLAEVKQTPTEAVAPEAVAPDPVVVEVPEATRWPLILGLLALVLLGVFVRYRRQQASEGVVTDSVAQENSIRATGFDPQKRRDIHASHREPDSAALVRAAPVVAPVAAQPNDEFPLKQDNLSMDSHWELVSPFDTPPPAETSLHTPELEWELIADSPSQDARVFVERSDGGQSLELEPLSPEPATAAKARACMRNDDLDSAINLSAESLKDGHDSLTQNARSQLAGIR